MGGCDRVRVWPLPYACLSKRSIFREQDDLFADALSLMPAKRGDFWGSMSRELSAYRFVGDRIVHITAEAEVAAIENALKDTSPLSGVNRHLDSALEKLADRRNPDCRNSIKESISAVEALACLITHNPKATKGYLPLLDHILCFPNITYYCQHLDTGVCAEDRPVIVERILDRTENNEPIKRRRKKLLWLTEERGEVEPAEYVERFGNEFPLTML